VASLDTEPADGSPAVSLGDRYELLPDASAGAFAAPEIETCRARDRVHPGDALVALVCEPGVPPRTALLDRLSALPADTLMRPLEWGVADWPARQRRCFALVFEEPASRVAVSLADAIEPFSEEAVLTNVLPPLMAALKALHDVGVTHRAVRPTNLFRRAGDPRILLGECVSVPPASLQPLAFETVESCLATRMGRGAGAPADDLYALGVTLLFLLLGRDPAQGIEDAPLLDEKITRGSFATLLGSARPPPRMLEAIRGLLADDPRERWTLLDLDTWMNRRRVAARQFTPPKRAMRPLEVGGAAYISARPLAQALMSDVAAAVKPIRAGTLEAWVLRSLADPDRIAAMGLALNDLSEAEGAAREARLVARVAMALDPAAPLRYMGFCAAVDGFGPALATAFHSGNGATTIADAIMVRLPQFWFGVQGPLRPEQNLLLKTFDRMRLLLEDRRLGYGLARVLYEMNPGLHCLSPAIEREHVLEPAELLPALERAAADGRITDTIFDRHLAAFVAAHCRNAPADWQDEIASGIVATRVLGTIRLLAWLQRLGGPRTTPALVGRIAGDLPALIERYRSRTRRARLKASLGRVAAKGNLAEILAHVASPAEQRQDEAEYIAARDAHAMIERDLQLLRQAETRRGEQAAELGSWLAVLAATVLAAVVAGGTFVLGS